MASKTADEAPEMRKSAYERENGPWDEWELSNAAEHLELADKLSGNPKFLEAIRKHSEKKAAEHQHVADHAARLAKSGKISEKQLAKMKERREHA